MLPKSSKFNPRSSCLAVIIGQVVILCVRSVTMSLIFILSSCTIIKEQPKFVPAGDYALVALSAKYVSHTSSELVYSATLLVLERNYIYGDITFLDKSSFNFYGNGTSSVSGFASTPIKFSSGQPSFFLLDQSGSYSKIDPNNLRSQVVGNYFEDCSQSNVFQAGGFSMGGHLTTEPVQFLTGGFTNSWQAPAQSLFALAQLTGGQSNLYDAINTSIGAFGSGPAGSKRNCLILSHANDQASTLSMNSVLQNAVNANVSINLTSLDSSVNKLPIAALTMKTGGWLAICNTPEQMVTVVANWNRLISGEATAYTFTITLQSATVLSSGNEILTKVNVSSPYLNSQVNSAYLYIKIP